MTNDTPTLCTPPDPSVSGWWWLHDGYDVDGPRARQWNPDPTYDGGGWWSVWACEPCSPEEVVGPVTPHAEVEALRAEIQRLRATIEIVHYKLGTGGWALPLILRDMQDALNGQSDAATRALLREIGLLRAEGTALIQILFALPKGTLVVPPSAQTAIHNAILAASAPAPEDK